MLKYTPYEKQVKGSNYRITDMGIEKHTNFRGRAKQSERAEPNDMMS